MTTEATRWEASRSRRLQVALIPRLIVPVMKALASTWRLEAVGMDAFDQAVAAGRAPIIACWHQIILPGTAFWRDRNIAILASQNFDGEWITRTLRAFGYVAARGSSSRGGARALITLSRLMRQGHAAAITLDGPRGPARHAQPGALWLAQHTGHPILPFHVAASSAWHVSSWDRSVVPKPGSRVVLVVGEPFHVSSDLDAAGLEKRRLDLESALNEVEARATARVEHQAP